MARWESGAPERLARAALELFATRGFEQTTAADIAAAVGLTERTFFRHFADKREVLFAGRDSFEGMFLDVVAAAPPDEGPMTVLAAAVRHASTMFDAGRRAHSRTRQAVIEANPSLQERERHKLAGLADALAAAVRARGIADPAATLAAEAGVTVFRTAFATWVRAGETRSFEDIADELFGELRAVVGGGRPAERSIRR